MSLESSHQGGEQREELRLATSPPVPEHIALVAAAERLDMHPDTLRRYAKERRHGCPPAITLGDRNLHFRVDEITAWLESRRRAAEAGDAQSA